MGQKQSKGLAVPVVPEPDPEFLSARVLSGAFILRNKATGTCLRLAPSTPGAPECNPGSNEVQKGDVVGWDQDNAGLDTLEDEIWWVEWDDIHKAHIISNVSKGLVLDFRFPAVQSSTQKKAAAHLGVDARGVVCARSGVKNPSSPRTSNKSSARSSIDLITREEALSEEPPLLTVEDCIKKQRWKFKRSQPTSETFSIHNLYDPSLVLDLDWAKPENGTKVQLCPRTGVSHQQWTFVIPQLPGETTPLGSWVFIRNSKTGAFLHHVDKNYAPAGIKLPKWEGICEKREYWGLHWCFVRVPHQESLKKESEVEEVQQKDEKEERWYIRNRLTGTLLEHVDGKRRGDSVFAENGDTNTLNKRKEWKVKVVLVGDKSQPQGGRWAIINEESGCALDHYGGRSIQCYHPGLNNDHRQWRIMEASTPFTSHSTGILTPLSTLAPLPAPRSSLPTTFDTSSLLPLLMPTSASFDRAEQATWPFPAPAPCSRDVLGHEERCFFELMSRIEMQLVCKKWSAKKRILGDVEEGWTRSAFGYEKGEMANWNNLINSETVRSAEVWERYVLCFEEAVVIIKELLEKYYIETIERCSSPPPVVASSSLAASGKVPAVQPDMVIALPTRLTYLIIMAAYSLERVVSLRRNALGLDSEENIYSRTAGCDSEKQRDAKTVNKWVLGRLEGALKGLEGVEEWCRAGVERKWFVQ